MIGNRCCRSEPLDGTKLAADLRQATLEKTAEQERCEENDDSEGNNHDSNTTSR